MTAIQRLGGALNLHVHFHTLALIGGQRQYLWRAVDQEGAVLDLLVQPRRDARAARRLCRRRLTGQGRAPAGLVTSKLGSYRAAHRVVMPSIAHDT